MTIIKITNKQTEILSLLFKFRFLNRKQIQTMLSHKYPSRIFNWLDKLTQNEYLNCSYQKNFQTLPAIYSLGKNGRKYLKKNIKAEKKLERSRKEAKCSKEFINHCLFIGDIYLSLKAFAKSKGSKLKFYTKTDLYGMEHLITPHPDAYFAIEDKTGNIKRYFLEIPADNLRPNILRRRVKGYLNYYSSDEWQDNTSKPFPEIIIICPNERIKNHLYYVLKSRLDVNEPKFYLATKPTVQNKGFGPDVLEEVKIEG